MRVVAGAAILGSILGGYHKGTAEMRCTNRADVEANVPPDFIMEPIAASVV
jgi:hypothetical protein